MEEIEKKLAEAVGKKENYSLEDVLVAIEKEKDLVNDKKYYDVLEHLMDYLPEKGGWKLNIPFHEQSDDTKKFIGNLLK